MKKKVLILGNTANVYALAKKMSEFHDVYVAPGSEGISEFANSVDIRDTSPMEILNFVMENEIDITIPISAKSLNTDIVRLFNQNNAKIFAPNKQSSKIINDKVFAKKLLYRLKIPTPKFGIFEKPNMVFDYLKNQQAPFVIKTNNHSSSVVLTSVKSAKIIIDSIMAESSAKVTIEDYIYGIPFAFYTITDGYKALPIGSSIIYKHSLEGNGGQLTSGMGACSPNYKLSYRHEDYIMSNIVNPILSQLEGEGNPYLGILGVSGILTDRGDVQILSFKNFMQDSDCAGILELIDMDIYELFDSCIIGSFSDEVEVIPIKNLYSVSVTMHCKSANNSENVITGLNLIDSDTLISMNSNIRKNKYLEYTASSNAAITITSIGKTPNYVTRKVYDEVENVKFKGIHYRKDICNGCADYNISLC